MTDVSAIAFETLSPGNTLHQNSSTESSRKYRLDPDNLDKSNQNNNKGKRTQASGAQDLSPEELQNLTELKRRDREVKAHEQAHIASGGAYVRSGAQYEYEMGPDGRKYAVGGEVEIDTSKVPGDPKATIRKMQTIRSAALAPADPSTQDRNVAAEATRIENQMRLKMLTKRYAEAVAFETGESGFKSEEIDDETDSRPPSISLGGIIDLVS